MKAIEFNGNEIEITWANALTAGYGHKRITVELRYNGEHEAFSAVTDNMIDYDVAVELEGEEKYKALFNLIDYKIEDEIIDWVNEINN